MEPWSGLGVEAAEWGVVEMERVTICADAPGVTGFAGANAAFVPAGSGVAWDMLNVTGSGNVPFEGERVNANVAVPPALTGGNEVGAVNE
jgi:hypothetical protein